MSTHDSKACVRSATPVEESFRDFTITFLLCPPTSGVDAIAMPQAAARAGITPCELWFRAVRRSVDQLLGCNPDGCSRLDEIVSEALGEPVMVWDAQYTQDSFGGFEFPGLTFRRSSVLTLAGRPTSGDLANRNILYAIADALMDATRGDFAACTITDGATEAVFPFSRRTEKEVHHA